MKVLIFVERDVSNSSIWQNDEVYLEVQSISKLSCWKLTTHL